jgi:hypothetical protein
MFPQKRTLKHSRKEFITQNSFETINTNKILVKVNHNTLDKYHEEYSRKNEKIYIWDLDDNRQSGQITNHRSADYQNFLLVDTNRLISISHKATHKPKYSLIGRKKLHEHQTVFTTKVRSYTLESDIKKKQSIKKFDKTTGFKIKGNVYYENVSQDGSILITF